mmetsp:Transcript_23727/g.51873  ORF Transcript_23727/g.51873 Transcript_23727/m.51873 type:complete len:213 (-) Transcript_23727:2015-2653(-)
MVLVGTINFALQRCRECLCDIYPRLFDDYHFFWPEKIHVEDILVVRTDSAASGSDFLVVDFVRYLDQRLCFGCVVVVVFVFDHFCDSGNQPMIVVAVVVVVVVVVVIVHDSLVLPSLFVFPNRSLRDRSTTAGHWFRQINDTKRSKGSQYEPPIGLRDQSDRVTPTAEGILRPLPVLDRETVPLAPFVETLGFDIEHVQMRPVGRNGELVAV